MVQRASRHRTVADIGGAGERDHTTYALKGEDVIETSIDVDDEREPVRQTGESIRGNSAAGELSISPSPVRPAWAWLRWIMFVPAGVLAGIAAGFLVIGVAWLNGMPTHAPLNQLLSAAATGYVAVLAAAHVAPTTRRAVPAGVMAGVLFVIYALSILLNLQHREWLRVVVGLVGAIAAGAAVYQQTQEDDELAVWG